MCVGSQYFDTSKWEMEYLIRSLYIHDFHLLIGLINGFDRLL